MKNKIKKLNIVLLSLVMVFSLALPAMAAVTPVAKGPDSGSTLVLNYKPEGNTPVAKNEAGEQVGITFSLYRVAEPNQDYSAYQLTEGYQGADLQKLVDDMNDKMFFADNPQDQKYQSAYPEAYQGSTFAAAFDYKTVQTWIRSFGGYINNNANDAEESNTASKPVASNEMKPEATGEMGTAGTLTFKNLPDGIYLVASNKAYKINDKNYVAAPFILQLPLVTGEGENQIANNYVTAYAKWFTPAEKTTYTAEHVYMRGNTVVARVPSNDIRNGVVGQQVNADVFKTQEDYNGVKYEYKGPNAPYMNLVLNPADNVFTLYYSIDEEPPATTRYAAVHVYRFNNAEVGRVLPGDNDWYSGTIGAVVEAASIPRQLEYDGNTYRFTGDDGNITLVADPSSNLIYLYYDRYASTYEPPVDIPEDEVPLAEPEIEDIEDEEVPLAVLPDFDEEIEPDLEIPDEDVPLAMLPQTGLLWWPVPVMCVAGLMCLGIGTVSKKKGD